MLRRCVLPVSCVGLPAGLLQGGPNPLPRPPPISLEERERARVERAKGRIHSVIVRHYPTCRRPQYLCKDEAGQMTGGAGEPAGGEDVDDGDDDGEDEEGLICRAVPFYNVLNEPAGHMDGGQKGEARKKRGIRAEPSHRAGGHVQRSKGAAPECLTTRAKGQKRMMAEVAECHAKRAKGQKEEVMAGTAEKSTREASGMTGDKTNPLAQSARGQASAGLGKGENLA